MSYENIFSDYYDDLTFNVDYVKRLKYISDMFERLDHDFGLSLDLGCGTGTIALMMAKKGVDVIGLDCSTDMLSVASDKAYDENADVLWVNQSMDDLELPYMIDSCISTLDAINHLKDKKSVQNTFDRVFRYLSTGGVFMFDLNTVYKHDRVLADNTFTYDIDGVFLVWKNRLLEDHTVEITLEFTDESEDKYIERFYERAYDLKEIMKMLESAGFDEIYVYDDLTFEKPHENSEKVTFVARKNTGAQIDG